ncbi:MAG: hypothetical protein ACJAYC_003329 [Halieaceae bacterium]|jgi:hypothetical protein
MPAFKEPHYFSPKSAGQWQIPRITNEKGYLALFDSADKQSLLGEASSAYLRSPESPGLIKAALPDVKIIICLREPADRAFSHFLMHLRSGYTRGSLEDYLDDFESGCTSDSMFEHSVIEAGYYGTQLQRYIDVFEESKIKIIWFDQLSSSPQELMLELLGFLGLKASLPAMVGSQKNSYFAPRGKWALALLHNQRLRKLAKRLLPGQWKWRMIRLLGKEGLKPELSEATRERLKDIYQDEMHALARITELPTAWGYDDSMQ